MSRSPHHFVKTGMDRIIGSRMRITDQHHANPPPFHLYFSRIFQSRKVITTGKRLKCTQFKAFIPKMCNLFGLFGKEIPDLPTHCVKKIAHCFLQDLGIFQKENTQASYIIAQLPLKSKSLEFNPYLSTKAWKTTNLNPTSVPFLNNYPSCL